MRFLTQLTTYQWLGRIVLGGLLVLAGILKVQDNTALFETIAYIHWLPVWVKSFLIDLLPWFEIAVGLALFIRPLDPAALPAAAALYLGFFLFAVYGLTTGLEGDCGCFGDLGENSFFGSIMASSFDWKMVLRNGIFVAMAGFLFWQPVEKKRLQ
ncbi:MAG: MauE/DoxX family redox-associated membrane protein [Balneolaceae bacterium]